MPFMCKLTHPKPYPEPTTPKHAFYPAQSTLTLEVTTGIRGFIVLHIYCFFFLNKWKPCDKPVLRKSVGTIFPAVLFFN